MRIGEIRRRLKMAKEEKVKDDISEIDDNLGRMRQEMNLARSKQRSVAEETKRTNSEIVEVRLERNDIEEYKDRLGDDYSEMATAMDKEIEKGSERIKELETLANDLEIQCSNLDAKISNMKDQKKKITGTNDDDEDKNQDSNTSNRRRPYLNSDTTSMVESCHPDVQEVFRETKQFLERIQAFVKQPMIIYYMTKIVSGKCRAALLQANTDDENTVIRRCIGAIKKAVVDDLNVRHFVEGINFSCDEDWQRYSRDADQQLRIALTGGDPSLRPGTRPLIKSNDYKTHQGAEDTSKRTNGNAQGKTNKRQRSHMDSFKRPHLAIPCEPGETLLSVMTRGQKANKPPKEKKTNERFADGELLSSTRGKKAVVLAGGADKNESIRRWMEEEFEFKSVRWYDKNASVMLPSLKNGVTDLLLVFPRWYAGYKKYLEAAESGGVPVVILENSNKKLICDEVRKSLLSAVKS